MNNSEWLQDEQGRYYRMDGKTKTFRPTIQTSFGTVYQDEIEEVSKRNREHQARAYAEMRAEQEAIFTGKHCPFRRLRGSMHCSCEKSCDFYQGDGCVFSGDQVVPTARGKFCPLADRCDGDLCSLYKEEITQKDGYHCSVKGCSLSGIRKGELDE